MFFIYIILYINNLITRTRDFKKITPTLNKINKLFAEIDDYNDTYFSKFLFSFWLFFGSVIVLSIYQMIFSDVELTMRILMSYICFAFSFIFFRIIFTASSINHHVEILNKALRKVFMSHAKFSTNQSANNVRVKIKVMYITVFPRIQEHTLLCGVIWYYPGIADFNRIF